MMQWNPGDRVITAFAEHAKGPGWSNRIVNVVIRSADGYLREATLQPEEQTAEMQTLFNISEEAHLAMLYAVERLVYEK